MPRTPRGQTPGVPNLWTRPCPPSEWRLASGEIVQVLRSVELEVRCPEQAPAGFTDRPLPVLSVACDWRRVLPARSHLGRFTLPGELA